jgi:hypothetical protein
MWPQWVVCRLGPGVVHDLSVKLLPPLVPLITGKATLTRKVLEDTSTRRIDETHA